MHAKLVSAELDPDRKIPLDLDWKNNFRTLKHQEKENKKGGNYYIDVIRRTHDPGIQKSLRRE
jgi:hypothetical protein